MGGDLSSFWVPEWIGFQAWSWSFVHWVGVSHSKWECYRTLAWKGQGLTLHPEPSPAFLMNIRPLDPDGSGEESEVGDLVQPSLTQMKANCKSCHHLDIMVLFENKGQTQQLYYGEKRWLFFQGEIRHLERAQISESRKPTFIHQLYDPEHVI